MNRVDEVRPEAREFSEAAEVIARGRELVKKAQRSAEEANQQAEEAQVTLEQQARSSTVRTNSLMKFQAIELCAWLSPSSGLTALLRGGGWAAVGQRFG